MPELIVNDLIQHNSLKEWIVFKREHVLENYKTVFGERGITGLGKALVIYQSSTWHEIKRYYQYVGVLMYTPYLTTLSMKIIEVTDMNEFLDGYKNLKDISWKEADLKQVGDIAQQILDDKNKILASVRLEKVL
ncbi:MAG TPA: hypothetical protein VIM89_22125 [Mucilaginibacter sp.]